jgi:TonB family protein
LEEDLACMVEHEYAHRTLGHSWDLMIAEICCILFWFNPMVYIYKFLLLEIHEYQADRAVLSHYSIKSYANLLLQRAMNTRVSLFHTFSTQSQLKKRLNMMTNLKNQNNQSWKYWLTIPLMIALVIAFINPQANAQVVEEPDEMPVYGDCSGDADAVKSCSMKNLITAMVDQIKYPKDVKKEGKVFIEFVVAKNGKVKDAKVLKPLDPACDAEALRVVKGLDQWSAGKKDGKKVDVKMVLPIAFKKE